MSFFFFFFLLKDISQFDYFKICGNVTIKKKKLEVYFVSHLQFISLIFNNQTELKISIKNIDKLLDLPEIGSKMSKKGKQNYLLVTSSQSFGNFKQMEFDPIKLALTLQVNYWFNTIYMKDLIICPKIQFFIIIIIRKSNDPELHNLK